MRRRVLAALAGFALMSTTVLIGVGLTAGTAQAATPAAQSTTQDSDCLKPVQAEDKVLSFEKLSFGHVRGSLPCRQIEITNNCDETVTVLVKNTGDADAIKVRFRINPDGPNNTWTSEWLGGGESDTVTLSAEDAAGVDVESFYLPSFGWRTFATVPEWSWNASCLEVTAVSNCDNTFKVSVKNTSTADGKFVWSLGLDDTKETSIEAGATLSENFDKGDVVQIRVGKDNELVKTLEFVQPKDCPSATPTTSAPGAPAPNDNDDGGLPVTGAALTGPLAGGGALVLIAAVGLFFVWRKRRSEETAIAGSTKE